MTRKPSHQTINAKGMPHNGKLQFALRISPDAYDTLKAAAVLEGVAVQEAGKRVIELWAKRSRERILKASEVKE